MAFRDFTFPKVLADLGLTRDGTADWVAWSPKPDLSERKAKVTPRISGLTPLNGGTATAAVAVMVPNNPPTAAADAVAVAEDAPATPVNVLANDSTLPDATEALTITAVTQGANGHVTVNGKHCDIPSILLKAGDKVSIKNRPGSAQLVKLNQQTHPQPIPDFLEIVPGEPPEGRLTRLPTRSDVDPRLQGLQEQLIIEFCSR